MAPRRLSTAMTEPATGRTAQARSQGHHLRKSAERFAAVVHGAQRLREGPVLAAGSTDRCNTFGELLSWGLIEQGLSRPFIKLPSYCAQLGLAMPGEIRAARKILAQ